MGGFEVAGGGELTGGDGTTAGYARVKLPAHTHTHMHTQAHVCLLERWPACMQLTTCMQLLPICRYAYYVSGLLRSPTCCFMMHGPYALHVLVIGLFCSTICEACRMNASAAWGLWCKAVCCRPAACLHPTCMHACFKTRVRARESSHSRGQV